MLEPLTEIALQAIVAQLEQITVAAGYFTDLGLGPITTEPTQQPEGVDAYTVVTDTEETQVSSSSGRSTSAVVSTTDLQVTIEFVVPLNRDLPQPARLARRARADIARALRRDARGLPKGITSLTVSGSQKLVFDDERYTNSVVGQVSVVVRLTDTTPPATP